MKTFICLFSAMLLWLQPITAQIPEISWEKQFSLNASYYFSDVVETIDGGFIFTGAIEDNPSTGSDIWLLACNSMGDTLHTKKYRIGGNDIPVKMLPLEDKGYLVAYVNVDNDNT